MMMDQISYRIASRSPQAASMEDGAAAAPPVVMELRSRKRKMCTRTFAWKTRYPVLLRDASKLLWYENMGSVRPSLYMNITNANNIRINTVEGHPTHLDIRYTPSSSSSSSSSSGPPPYGGSDQPKMIQDVDHDQEIIASWRVRFSTPQIALRWKDALEAVAATTAVADEHQWETAVPTTRREDATAGVTDGTMTTTTTTNLTTDTRRTTSPSRRYWTIIIFWIALTLGKRWLTMIPLAGGGGSSSRNNSMVLEMVAELAEEDDIGQRGGRRRQTAAEEEDGDSIMIHNPSPRLTERNKGKEEERRLIHLIHRVSPACQRWVSYTLWQSWQMSFPETQQTHLRQILDLPNACFHEETGMFPPDSLFYNYFLLLGPALVVFVLSVLSLGSRVIHWRLQVALLYFVLAALLMEDTYSNHWTHPLRYGLYWYGYGQMGAVLFCLLQSFIQVQKFRGWRPPNPPRISNRRKVASGLAAALASTSIPLSLRAMAEEEEQPRGGTPPPSASVCFWMAAVFTLLTGMHFFGWARRDLVVAGIPVGEKIYQASLIPTNVALAVLRISEDTLHYALKRLYRDPTICAAWNQVEGTIDAVLSLLFERLIPFAMKRCRIALEAIESVGHRMWRNLLQPLIVSVRRVVLAVWNLMGSCLLACSRVCQQIMVVVGRLLQRVACSMNGAARAVVNQTRTVLRSLAATAGRIFHFLDDKVRFAIRTLHHYLLDPMCLAVKRQARNAINLMICFLRFLGDRIRVTVQVLLQRLAVLGRTIVRFLCLVGDETAVVMKAVLCHLEPVRRAMMRVYLHATELVARFLRLLWYKIVLAVQFIRFHLNPQKHGLMGRFLTAIEKAVQCFWHAVRKILQGIISVCTSVLDRVGRFSARLCSFLYATFILPAIRVMSTVLKALYNVAAAVLSPFFKKYWQLVSAGLAFNGSYLFFLTALAESGSILGRIKFGLGSWSLALIGYTMIRSVVLSTGSLAARRVTVDESALKFMDMYLGYAFICIIRSGWHAISMAFELFLKINDFLVRKICKFGWWLLDGSFQSTIRPMLHAFKKIIKSIWNSPYFSMGASIGTVAISYILHKSQIAFPVHSITLQNLRLTWAATIALIPFATVLNQLLFVARFGGDMASAFYDAVYGPVANADTSSPGVALCCWVLSCAVIKTRKRVRVKTFAVPVVVFYVTGVAASSLLKAVCVSVLIWFSLSLFVDNYENQSRARARTAFQEFQSRRKSSSTRGVSDSSETCAICLDDFAPEAAMQEISLPCGHHFHDKCIIEWFRASPVQRCPLCRRAARGWDRVLEVAF